MRQTEGETENEGRERGSYHRFDEWEWWQKPSGNHSVTETALCGPDFIIMTQSHQHTPTDKSTAELGWKTDQSGPVGLQWCVTDADRVCSDSLWLILQKIEMHLCKSVQETAVTSRITLIFDVWSRMNCFYQPESTILPRVFILNNQVP